MDNPVNNVIPITGLVVRVNLGKHSTISQTQGVFVVDFTIVEEKTISLTSDEAGDSLFASRRANLTGFGIIMIALGVCASLIAVMTWFGRHRDPEDAKGGLVFGIAAGPLLVGGFLLRKMAQKIKEEVIHFESMPKKRLEFFRREALKRMAKQYGYSFGWPLLEIDNMYTGKSSYHAKGGQFGLLDPKEFAKDTRWVVDPHDKQTYYHKDYDRNNPNMPFLPRP